VDSAISQGSKPLFQGSWPRNEALGPAQAPKKVVSTLSEDQLQTIEELAKAMGGKDPKKPLPLALSYGEIYEIHSSFKDELGSFLVGWLYLTGQRVTEMCKTRRADVRTSEVDGKEYIVVESITEKNRTHRRRPISIPMFGREKPMVEACLARFDKYSSEWPVFGGDRYAAYYRLAKREITVRAFDYKTRTFIDDYAMPLHPHYLRHCRADHLAMDYEFPHIKLMKFFGWHSSTMADLYVSGSWKDLARGFGEGLPASAANSSP